jgi:hypothetical protein
MLQVLSIPDQKTPKFLYPVWKNPGRTCRRSKRDNRVYYWGCGGSHRVVWHLPRWSRESGKKRAGSVSRHFKPLIACGRGKIWAVPAVTRCIMLILRYSNFMRMKVSIVFFCLALWLAEDLQLKGDPGDLKFFQLKERLCRQK